MGASGGSPSEPEAPAEGPEDQGARSPGVLAPPDEPRDAQEDRVASGASDVLELDLDDLEVAAEPAGTAASTPPPAPPASTPPPAPPASTPPPAPPAASDRATDPGSEPRRAAPEEDAGEAPTEQDPIAEALRWARSEDIDALLAAYRREVEAAESPAQRAVLHYEMGAAREARAGDEPGAIKSYSQALKEDREFLPNLWAIRRVFWRRELWPNLLKLLDVELKVVADSALRRAVLLEKGDVLRRHQGDLGGAIACYEEAHALDPTDLAPILVLEKVYAEQGRLGDLFRVGRAHVEATEDPARRASLLVSLARLEEQLPDADYERRRDLLRRALAEAPGSESVRYELERIARAEGRTEDLLYLLAQEQEQFLGEGAEDSAGGPEASASAPAEEAAESAEEAAESAEETAESPEEAAESAEEAAGPAEDAAGTAEHGAPQVDEEVSEAAAPGGAGGAGPEPRAADPARWAAAVPAIRRARLLEAQGDGDAAWQVLETFTDRMGPHPVILGLQQTLAARLGRWGDLADRLAQTVGEVPPAERPFWVVERLLALRRAGRDEAADAVLAELASQPDVTEVVWALQELDALSAGDPRAEAALVDRMLTQCQDGDWDPGDAAARDGILAHLWFRRALLSLESGEPLETAISLLRQVRAQMPEHAGATALLEALLTAQGAWDDLASLLRQELVGADGAHADYLLESLASLQGGVRSEVGAWLESLRALRERHPEDPGVTWRLAAALARAGKWTEQVSVLEALASDSSLEPSLAVQAALWGARSAWERLQDAERAERLLRAALELGPGHAEALATLEWILREAGQTESLVEVLCQGADSVLDPEVQRERLLRAGWLLERDADRAEAAAAIYARIVDLMPEDLDALHLWARACARAGDAEGAARALEQAAAAIDDPPRKARIYGELGEWLWHTLQETDRAADAFLAARAAAPDAPEPLLWLADLAAAQRDWDRLREVLDELSRMDLPADLRRFVQAELAWLTEVAVSDPGACEVHLESMAAGEASPPPSVAWARLRLALAAQAWPAVVPRAGAARALAEGANAPDLADALALRESVLARLQEPEGDPVAAWTPLREAAARAEASPVVRVLAADLLPVTEEGAAARLAARRAQLGPEEADDWAIPWAAALLRQGDAAAAAEALCGVLRGEPGDLPVLAALRGIAVAAGDSALAADCCERMALLLVEDEAAVALLRQGADLVPRTESAARMLRRALERAPEDRELLERLVETLLALDRAEEAAQVLSVAVAQASEEDARLAFRLQRARVRQDRLADGVGAAVDLYEVLSIDPEHAEALVRLARLLAEDGGYDEAADLLRRRIELGEGPGAPGELRLAHRLLAEVLERAGRPLEEVLEPLDALLLVDATDTEAWEAKFAACLRARDWEGAVAALRGQYETASDPAARVEGLLREARVYREHAANWDAARRAYERAREVDPRNRVAILALCDLYREFEDSAALGYLLSGAVEAYREALGAEEAVDPDTVRFLARLFEEGGEKDAHFFALSALEVLGDIRDDEAQALERYRGAIVDRRPGRLTAEHWNAHLCEPDAMGPVASLWELVSPAAYRLVERDLGDYGLGRGDRVQPSGASGAARAVFEVASEMGVPLESLYVGDVAEDGVSLLATRSGPVVVLGPRVATRLPAAVRHQVGACLATLRLAAAPLEALAPEWVEALLTAAAQEGHPDFETQLPRDRLEEAARHLRKGLSRKARKSLPVAGAALSPSGLDLDRWKQAVARTVARAGLLCSGDLAASLREVTGAAPGEAASLPAGRALIRFALSDAHIELRLRLGVAR